MYQSRPDGRPRGLVWLEYNAVGIGPLSRMCQELRDKQAFYSARQQGQCPVLFSENALASTLGWLCKLLAALHLQNCVVGVLTVENVRTLPYGLHLQ